MNAFPFPDRETSIQELKNDYVFSKIEPQRVKEVFEDAWAFGELQARRFLAEYGGRTPMVMLDILKRKGVTISYRDIDYVMGKRRYFCEYYAGMNLLKIYKKSVTLWCGENGFSYGDGLNVILLHEYFHYLENTEIGMASRRYLVPMLRLGPLKLGTTGVPALSEIGANAFAGTCWSHLMYAGTAEGEGL